MERTIKNQTYSPRKVLFFHGGPGLNSNPEKQLLHPYFKEAKLELICWNEPSSQRACVWPNDPSSAYPYYLTCAEEFFLKNSSETPVILIGQSFGANAVCHLSNRFQDRISKIIFISTALDLAQTDLNMLQMVAHDFERHEDNRFKDLEKIIQNYSRNFDKNTEDGFNLYVQNPRWFSYYWHNNQHSGNYAAALNEPEFKVDLESFFKIRKSFYPFDGTPSNIPVTALFGKYDPIISKEHEIPTLKSRFKNLKTLIFENSAHYPHIEQTKEFMALI